MIYEFLFWRVAVVVSDMVLNSLSILTDSLPENNITREQTDVI